MGVVHVKSKAITARDSGELVLGSIAKANMRTFAGVVSIANGDSIGSTYRLGSIPSNARVHQLLASCPDIGTTTAADIGLYQTTRNGGAVADVDFFASALSLSGGALVNQDITSENGLITAAKAEQMVWELLGLTKDPGVDYDVVATLTAAADAAGELALKGSYAV